MSPLLFNLVTQNLTTILNHALLLNLVPGFDPLIMRNFNHLMFADDLLLITNASRKRAKNCLFYLKIFKDLTGQSLNLNKSAFFVPSWCNSHLAKSISKILNINLSIFPLHYLGVPISLKNFQFPSVSLWWT